MTRRALCAVLLTAVTLCAAGCHKQFTRPRYETLYIGQPAEQVEKTLGKPDARFQGTWTYIHDDPFYKAIIKFDHGRVVDKAWYDRRQFEEVEAPEGG